MLVGWMGGLAVSVLNQSAAVTVEGYLSSLKSGVDSGEIFEGIFKSVVFALAVGIISCHQGLVTRGGPRGIGRSVTKSVVNSIAAVLILDYILTRLILFF
jgi:phospholipid/cholesterol/gamma-HCH transport system permease protein